MYIRFEIETPDEGWIGICGRFLKATPVIMKWRAVLDQIIDPDLPEGFDATFFFTPEAVEKFNLIELGAQLTDYPLGIAFSNAYFPCRMVELSDISGMTECYRDEFQVALKTRN